MNWKYIGLIGLSCSWAAQDFSWQEMLGEISDHSVRINAVPVQNSQLQVDYVVHGSSDTLSSTPIEVAKDSVAEFLLSNLQISQSYDYRLKFRTPGSSTWNYRDWHHFVTAKTPGQAFVFDIQADPHLDDATDSATYAATQKNIVADKADFLIDLGDTFLSEKYSKVQDTLHHRLFLAREWYDHITHSLPLMIAIGNHEGELGWLNNGSDTNFAVRAAKERVKYYPNPKPNGFYSGDTSQTPFVGQRESWYAWTWGDALMVVIDPYWNAKKVKNSGAESGWSFTLGTEQYNWLKTTLRNSKAKFKFVFSHQLVGGDEPFIGTQTQGTGRGGAKWAHLYEMGGYNKDSSYVWSQMRPGWEKPLHDLFVETGVNVFFHGHDHLFSMEEKDGVIYQECPQPGLANHTVAGNADVYGYLTHIIPNSGHMRISVNGQSAQVEYIRSFAPQDENPSQNWINGQSAYSYTLQSTADQTPVQKALPSPTLRAQVQEHSLSIQLDLPSSGQVDLTLMDLSGVQMHKILSSNLSAGSHHMDSQIPAAGEYLLLLNSQGKIKTQRFVVP